MKLIIMITAVLTLTGCGMDTEEEKERAAQDAKKAYFCEEFGCE